MSHVETGMTASLPEGTQASQLAQIVDQAPTGIYAYDRDGRFTLVNRRVLDGLGLTDRDELIGRRVDDVLPPDVAAAVLSNHETVIEGGQAIEFEEEASDAEVPGGMRTFLSVKFPLRDETGSIDGTAGISTDITPRKEAWREVDRLRREAEQANEAKNVFLSRMSHELRTPLNAILGFGQLLEMADLGEDDADAVHHILKSGRHLLALIDEVMQISRIETGRMALSVEPVDLHTAIRETVGLMRTQGAERGIDLRVVTRSVSCFAMADNQRLRQILLNLLSNAVKYNRDGGQVVVSVEVSGDERVRLSVADTGFGIPADRLHRLFEPFDRLGAESATWEGIGLGLALSRSLAEAMHGTMGVENDPGRGATFWLELRRAGADALGDLDDVGDDVSGDRPSYTVVHIEDNEPNLHVVERALDRLGGVRVLATMQGRLGLTLVHDHRPTLVLLDRHLPDMDGLDVLSEIRRNPATRSTPVVIITADGSDKLRKHALACGASDVLNKPLDISLLLETVERHLDGGEESDRSGVAG